MTDATGTDAHPPSEATDDAAALLEEVAEVLKDLGSSPAHPVRLESDLLRDLGLDSLAIVELHDRIEHAFGVTIDAHVLADAATPAAWLRAVADARGSPPPRVDAAPVTTPRRADAPWPADAPTLVDALAWHVHEHPDLVTIRLLHGRDGRSEDITYRALSDDAERVARGLLAHGLAGGDRVAIMLPTCREFFAVFLGILLAGGVPVPLYPPARRDVLGEHLTRQAGLLANAEATALVTIDEAMLVGRLLRAHVPSLASIVTADDLVRDGSPGALARPGADDVALVQYTSGSTGDPKGVVLTHRQLLANLAAMGDAAEVSTSDVFVSWLPLYHDMGLIGAWHAPLFFGMPLVVMPPQTFLAHPVRWLEAISAHGGTLSAAPNFAYQSCVDRIPDGALDDIDLSSWRIAFNGSEPVQPEAMERFTARFAPRGFRHAAMCPAYGLAEVGVGAAFTPPGGGPRIDTIDADALAAGEARPVRPESPTALRIVGCGVALPGYELRVTDAEGTNVPDRREGAVWCRGPSATRGYLANAAATEALWRDGWLATGDLGYMVGPELFLTGRAKDLVVRGGRNIHPEALETAAERLEGVVRGGVAVFAATDARRGTEALAVVVEADIDPAARAELTARIRSASVDLTGTPADHVAIVRRGTLLRTPSGKIRRDATRRAYEAGTLERRARPVPVQLARFARGGLGGFARRWATSAARWAYAAYAWSVAVAIAAPLAGSLVVVRSRRARWAWVRGAGRLLQALTGIRVRVDGDLDATPSPLVITANHGSFVDGLVLLLASREPLAFVSSTEVGRTPVVGRFLRGLGCRFVERGRADRAKAEIDELAAFVAGGARLVVFPEGTIDPVAGLRPFHLGAFAVAAAAECPVVPVSIRGAGAVLRPGSYRPRRAPVVITVGSPLSARGKTLADQADLSSRVRAAIATALER